MSSDRISYQCSDCGNEISPLDVAEVLDWAAGDEEVLCLDCVHDLAELGEEILDGTARLLVKE